MTGTDIDHLIERIIDREGGYVDHPADRGGPTKWGLSQRFLSSLWGRSVLAAEIKGLKRETAVEIYRIEFVVKPWFDRIADAGLRAQVIDAGIHMGAGWATRRLQEIVGVTVDGIVGPVTLHALSFASEVNGLAETFRRRRVHKLCRIVQNNPTQLVFLTGWVDRAMAA